MTILNRICYHSFQIPRINLKLMLIPDHIRQCLSSVATMTGITGGGPLFSLDWSRLPINIINIMTDIGHYTSDLWPFSCSNSLNQIPAFCVWSLQTILKYLQTG